MNSDMMKNIVKSYVRIHGYEFMFSCSCFLDFVIMISYEFIIYEFICEFSAVNIIMKS